MPLGKYLYCGLRTPCIGDPGSSRKVGSSIGGSLVVVVGLVRLCGGRQTSYRQHIGESHILIAPIAPVRSQESHRVQGKCPILLRQRQ